MTSKNKKYDEALSDLKKIVDLLERKEIKIDELTTQVKKARNLVEFCREKLQATENEIKEIIDPEEAEELPEEDLF